LVQQQISSVDHSAWEFVSYSMTSGSSQTPQVTVTLRSRGEEKTETVTQGDGPIDAAFYAVEKITGIAVVCKDFRVRSATLGRDAIGEVNVEVEYNGKSYRGVGVSTDSIESTIRAMLNAINRILSSNQA
jgi:2-isopropylmalate synthase